MRTALLAGATGLGGGHLLALLLEDDTWDRVVSVGRREVDVHHAGTTVVSAREITKRAS